MKRLKLQAIHIAAVMTVLLLGAPLCAQAGLPGLPSLSVKAVQTGVSVVQIWVDNKSEAPRTAEVVVLALVDGKVVQTTRTVTVEAGSQSSASADMGGQVQAVVSVGIIESSDPIN